MKIHFAIGLIIGAAINLAFQTTDAELARVDLVELCLCASLAAFATLLASALSGRSKGRHVSLGPPLMVKARPRCSALDDAARR